MTRQAFLALLLAGGCGLPGGDARSGEPRSADAAVSPDSDPCLRREGEVYVSVSYRDCVDFRPAERMRGVWITGFEESSFVPDVDSIPMERVIGAGSENPEFDTWLDIDAAAALAILGLPAMVPETRAFAVECIGRRARQRGAYAHLGPASDLILVDRVLSIRPLGRVWTRIEGLPGCEGACAGPR